MTACLACTQPLDENQPIFTITALAHDGIRNDFCSTECLTRWARAAHRALRVYFQGDGCGSIFCIAGRCMQNDETGHPCQYR